MSTKKTTSFESLLKELDVIVKQLESGTLSLEEALKQFETGVTLSKQCQSFLHTAEQQIRVLQEGELRTYDNDA